MEVKTSSLVAAKKKYGLTNNMETPSFPKMETPEMPKEPAKSGKTSALVAAKKKYSKPTVDESFINNFINDSQSFIKDSASSYDSLDWKTSKENDFNEKAQSFRTQVSQIRAFLDSDYNKFDKETESALKKYLDDVSKSEGEIRSAFSDAKKLAESFATEGDYNNYKAEQQKYTVDLGKLQEELTDLKKQTEQEFDWTSSAEREKRRKLEDEIAAKEAYYESAKLLQEDQKALELFDQMSEQEQRYLMAYASERNNNFSAILNFINAGAPDVVWVPGQGIVNVSPQSVSTEALVKLMDKGYTKGDIDYISDAYSRKANADSAKSLQKSAAQLAEENPVLANIVRVPLNLAGAYSGTIDYGVETLKSLLDKSKRGQPMDPNRPGAALGQMSDAIYSTTRENIESGKGGKLGGVAYGAATSLVDNIARFYAGGASKVGTLALAGASSFSDSVRDVSERGGTASQAALKGMADAASEIITEFLPLDDIIKLRSTDIGSVANLLKSALKQAGTEVATEEINFGVGLLSDALIMGDKSQANLQKQKLMSEGLSEKEAEKQVVRDILMQAGNLAAETALSAGAQAGIEGGANLYRSNKNSTSAQTAENIDSTTANVEQTPAQKGAQELGNLINDAKRIFVDQNPVSAQQAQKNTVPEETVVTVKSAGPAINERTQRDNALAYQLASKIDVVRDMEPVSALTGKEFSNRGTKLSDQIRTFFQEIGNRVFRNGFGEVDLGEYGVGGVLNHRPVNRAKIVSLAAVPDVIKNGKQIGYDPNWKGRGYESFIFAAPATVNGTPVYVAAVVDKRPNNKFYLSEMVDSEGNYVRIEESPSGNSKNGVTDGAGDSGKAGVTARPEELSKGSDLAAAAAPTLLSNSNIPNEQDSVNTKNEAVGAADRNFTGLADYYDLITDDNVQPARASDMGYEEVPIKDAFGNKVSENAANVINSGMLSARDVDNVKRLIADGAYGHQTQKMDDVRRQVISELEGKKLADEANALSVKVAKGNINEHDIAKAQILLAHYTQRKGEAAENKASQLLLDLEQMATQSGRQLNMFKLLRRMTPEGQTLTVKKRVDKYVEDLNNSRSEKKKADVKIPQELLNEHTKAAAELINNKDSKEARKKLEDIENQIYGVAASQIGSTFKEKWDAWRHMAMLGNVKTQGRNLGGNLIFKPFVSVKRAVGAALETAFEVPRSQRTKAIIGLGKNGRELLSLATADAKSNVEQYLKGSAKTGDFDRSKIDDKRVIFDYSASKDTSKSPEAVKKAWEAVNKGLEASRKGLTNLMEGTDMIFKRWEYRSSLASFIKARGYTAQQWKDGKIPAAVLDEGRAYAAKEAMKATFNDQNAATKAVSKLARTVDKIPVLNIAFEGVFPYTRTPTNVAVRAVEYSPVNVARSIVTGLTKVKSGKMTASECLDQLASGLTGTGAMVLGSILAGGIFGVRLVGAQDDEDKERAGHQKYSLEFGDKTSVTIDWAAPAVIPLFVGANLYNEFTNGEDDVSGFAKFVTSVGTTFEPMLELSCLSSLNDLLESKKDAEEGEAIYAAAAQIATSYLMQALPTLGSQFDQLGDDTRQKVYATSEDPTERAFQKFVGKASQKLPGDLYQTEYVDAWGRTDKTNWVESLVSPSYAQKIDNSPVEKEVQRLNSVQDKNVSPDTPQYTVTIDGKKRRLAPEEWTDLAKQQGQTAYNIIEKLIETASYKQLTDAEKAKAIDAVYEYAREYARVSVLKDYKEYSAEWMNGISGKEAQVIAERAIVSASGLSDARYERAKEQGVTLSQMKRVSSAVSEELENVKNKTDYDTYRAVLDNVKQEDSSKWLQIYGMSETRLEEMEQAGKKGISSEVYVDFLEAESKLDKAFKEITTAWKEGETASLEGLSNAYEAYDALPEEAKQYFQDGLGGRLEAFANAMDAGVSESTFIDLWKQYYELDNSSNKKSQNANQWAAILDNARMSGKLTQAQRDTMLNDLGFYSQLRQDAQKYHDLTSEGLKPDVALNVANMMTGITKTAERLSTLVNADITEADRKAAVYAYFDDKQDAKFKTITDMGFDTEAYAALYGLYSEESGDGKKKRVTAQYQKMYGLTSAQANKIYDIYAGKK